MCSIWMKTRFFSPVSVHAVNIALRGLFLVYLCHYGVNCSIIIRLITRFLISFFCWIFRWSNSLPFPKSQFLIFRPSLCSVIICINIKVKLLKNTTHVFGLEIRRFKRQNVEQVTPNSSLCNFRLVLVDVDP